MRTIAHIDMDAFFAAVEQHDNPELRGRPVIVGADPKAGRGRGVVCAASYEARKFGVHSAQPISKAWKLCPKGVFLPVRFKRYIEISEAIMVIFHDASPLVEPISLDEAFIDLTGTERLWGDPVETGRRIKRRILDEQGLAASVGIGPNKLIAKLASDHQKPDGFVFVPPEGVTDFLDPMPVAKLWGVGKKSEESLAKLGIRTIGELARYPLSVLESEYGKSGTALHERALGIDDSPVEPEREAKSVSRETTFEIDESDPEVLHDTLRMLAEDVAFRLRRDGIRGRTACLKVRFSDFTTRVLRSTTNEPDGVNDLFAEAVRLYESLRLDGEPIRLLGVGMTGLFDQEKEQLELFNAGTDKKKKAVEAMDSIKLRHGKSLIRRGA